MSNNQRPISIRWAANQYSEIQRRAEEEGTTAADWIRESARARLEQRQQEDRLSAMEARLSSKIDAAAARVIQEMEMEVEA